LVIIMSFTVHSVHFVRGQDIEFCNYNPPGLKKMYFCKK